MTIAAGTYLHCYEVLTPLGAGGMGEVYQAHDTKLGRDVAIKVLPEAFAHDPERLSRFQREAKILASLNHPNIATIHGFEKSNGTSYLVMELVSGETLAERIKREGALPTEEALAICKQIAEALEAAHAKAIIHRDLKPANIKVTPEGKVKVLDFGLAKAFSGDSDASKEDPSDLPTLSMPPTMHGVILGTAAYMSPEQARGKPVDKRTDIWAFGCLLFELLAGRQAFQGNTLADTLAAVLEREPDWRLVPSSTPAKIQALLHRCLQKDRLRRLHDIADARIEIEEAQLRGSVANSFENLRNVQPASADLPLAVAKRAGSNRLRNIGGVLLVAIVLGSGMAAIPSVRQKVRGWVGIPAIPQERQLAVLPFEVPGGDPSARAFSDGLTETLSAKLTKLTTGHDLQVVPASEVNALKVTSSESARDELGVNLILTGSLQQSGGVARVTYALVNTITRRQLRADTITIATADPFAGEDQVVDGVLRMLDLELQPAERQNLETHGTQVADAYDLYLQGRGYLQNYDKVENLQNAISVFQRALGTDPNYSLAYAGLGQAYWMNYQATKETQWVQPAREACERALELDRRLAPAHVCLATLASGTGQYEKAVAEFGRALEAEPTNDDAYRGLAEAYSHVGDLAQAEKTYRRAISLRPHYWAGYNWLGGFYFSQSRFADAAAMFNQVVTLVPDNIRGYYNLGAALNGQGRYREAIPTIEHSIDIRPTATAYTNLGNAYFYLRQYQEAIGAYEQAVQMKKGDYVKWWNLGDGYFWGGKRAQAMDAYRQAISLASEALHINPKDPYALGDMAICYAMLGEKNSALSYLRQGLAASSVSVPDIPFKAALVYNQFGEANQALKWLEKALAAGESPTIVGDTPSFDGLRSDPRFQKLLRPK